VPMDEGRQPGTIQFLNRVIVQIEIQQENKIDTATATVIRKFVVFSKRRTKVKTFVLLCSHNRKYVSMQLRKRYATSMGTISH